MMATNHSLYCLSLLKLKLNFQSMVQILCWGKMLLQATQRKLDFISQMKAIWKLQQNWLMEPFLKIKKLWMLLMLVLNLLMVCIINIHTQFRSLGMLKKLLTLANIINFQLFILVKNILVCSCKKWMLHMKQKWVDKWSTSIITWILLQNILLNQSFQQLNVQIWHICSQMKV